MTKAEASIVIGKSTDEVFEFAASPKSGPLYIPNLRENIDISVPEAQMGQTFTWRYDMMGVELEGTSEVTEFNKPNKLVLSTKGQVDSTWTFLFEDENGSTKVSLVVEYDIPENVMSKLGIGAAIEKVNQRVVEQSLDNLKTILEV